MSPEEAMAHIKASLISATGKTLTIDEQTELIADNVIDSLDAVRFIFELERLAGFKFPDGDLSEQGLFRVGNLVSHIVGMRVSRV